MADKILARRAGRTVQYTPTTASAGVADAGKVVALNEEGKIDPSMYDAGADSTLIVQASEALGAGKFVNLWSDSGTLKARLADNSNDRPAHGFVKVSVASAADATVFPLDAVNTALTALAVGSVYYLGTAGGVIASPLDPADVANEGFIDQKLGVALSATELATDDYDFVVL